MPNTLDGLVADLKAIVGDDFDGDEIAEIAGILFRGGYRNLDRLRELTLDDCVEMGITVYCRKVLMRYVNSITDRFEAVPINNDASPIEGDANGPMVWNAGMVAVNSDTVAPVDGGVNPSIIPLIPPETSVAIDYATLFTALASLEKAMECGSQWISLTPIQSAFFTLYTKFHAQVHDLKNINALASGDWNALNDFCQRHGVARLFEGPLGSLSIAAVSILDMMVKWRYGADPCDIEIGQRECYAGFKIDRKGFDLYGVDGHRLPLVRLSTDEEGNYLWIMIPPEKPSDVLGIASIAFDVMGRKRAIMSHSYNNIQVPTVKLTHTPDIDFLIGAYNGDWSVVKTMQSIRFEMNEHGAHAMVVSSVEVMRGFGFSESFIVNQPFICWMTQSNAPELPMAIVYADKDSWEVV